MGQANLCSAPRQFKRQFNADFASATDILTQTQEWLTTQAIPPVVIEDTSIVLVEVFNNIIQHAYGFNTPANAKIDLAMVIEDDQIFIDTYDRGAGMFHTPEPLRIDLANCELADLPESGFGWVLIERLSNKVVFSRSGGRNHLHICIKTPKTSQTRQ